MCDPCCLIVGLSTESRLIEKPLGHNNPPEKIICPHCSTPSKVEYRKDYFIFNLCLIPLCNCWSGEPYLACTNCRKKVPMIRGVYCQSCRLSRPFDSEFCPNCGTKISEDRERSLSPK